MELKYYLNVIKKRIWIILGSIFLTMAVVIIGSLLITPMYRSSTTIRIATTTGSSINYSDYSYADRLINTYITIANSDSTLELLRTSFGLNELPEVSVEAVPGTELLLINSTNRDPGLAADLANSLAKILIDQEKSLYGGGEKDPVEILDEQIDQILHELATARKEYELKSADLEPGSEELNALQYAIDIKEDTYATLVNLQEQTRLREAVRANVISIVEAAEIPGKPYKPNWIINLAAGFLFGLLGGLSVAFLWEHLDESLSSAEDIRKVTKFPNLCRIPKVNSNWLMTIPQKELPFTYLGAIHSLRANLLVQNGRAPLQVVMITSAVPGDGKSTITANLAFSAAKSGKLTLIIDCDLRKPKQHELFRVSKDPGLSQVLEGSLDWCSAIRQTNEKNIRLLTSGPETSDPTNLLSSAVLSGIIEDVRKEFEFVLIDTPAVLSVPDAKLICHLADNTLLVVNQRNATRETIQTAIEELNDSHAKVIGVVVNEARPNRRDYYYHYYQSAQEKK